jgi:hypothetical protein
MYEKSKTFLVSADMTLRAVDGATSIPPWEKIPENSYSPSKKSRSGTWKVARVVTCGGSRRNSCSSPFFFFFFKPGEIFSHLHVS